MLGSPIQYQSFEQPPVLLSQKWWLHLQLLASSDLYIKTVMRDTDTNINIPHIDLILVYAYLIYMKIDICVTFQQNNPADFEGPKNVMGFFTPGESTGVQRSIQISKYLPK